MKFRKFRMRRKPPRPDIDRLAIGTIQNRLTMKKLGIVVITCAAWAATAEMSHAAEPDKFSLGVGVFRSSGTYGGIQSTDILYVPVTGKYVTGDWAFKLIVPYLSITGPGNVLNGVGLTGNANVTTRTTQSGLGDVIAAATRKVYEDHASGLLVSLTGKIKFGTANSAKGLGTGQNDYAFQSNVSKPFGALTAFGSVGYRVYGSPAAYTLNNVFYGSLGGSYKLAPKTSAGLVFYMRQQALVNGYPQREALLFVDQKVEKKWDLQAYLLKGFSNGSPNIGAGVSAAYLF